MPAHPRCPAPQRIASAILPATRRRLLLPSLVCVSCLSAEARPRYYATVAKSAPGISALRLPDGYVPPTQPPSAKPPAARKTQLLRTYTSLLRSTPLMLLFQHNNLTALEWSLIRKELKFAMDKVSADAAGGGSQPDTVGPHVRVQVVRTSMFAVALKVLEFFDPASVTAAPKPKSKEGYSHDLSLAAWTAVKQGTARSAQTGRAASSALAQLEPLLVGPIALLTMPAASPAHLAAALSILAPHAPQFPAPTRRKNPSYHDPAVQTALQKLLLVGGRVESTVFDTDGVRWVGSIEGGMDALRARLVALLQGAGLGLANTLEGAGRSLWLTMESRRSVLEKEENPKKEDDGPLAAEETKAE